MHHWALPLAASYIQLTNKTHACILLLSSILFVFIIIMYICIWNCRQHTQSPSSSANWKSHLRLWIIFIFYNSASVTGDSRHLVKEVVSSASIHIHSVCVCAMSTSYSRRISRAPCQPSIHPSGCYAELLFVYLFLLFRPYLLLLSILFASPSVCACVNQIRIWLMFDC